MTKYREDTKMRMAIGIGILILAIDAPVNYSKPAAGQSADKSVAPNSNAVVYVYRYKQYIGYMVEPSVYCNEVQLARMDNGRYFKVSLSPGTYTFRSNDKQSGIEMELKAGEQYYIRVEIINGLLKQRGRLVLMAKEQGAYEIKKLKPLSASKIKDRSRVVVDEQQVKQP